MEADCGERLTLSISIVLAGTPMHERVRVASELGYRTLESWWPWEELVPTADQVAAFATPFIDCGARLHLLNFTQGASSYGGRGIGGWPTAEKVFWRHAEAVLSIGRLLGVRQINVLAGNVPIEGRAVALRTLEDRLVALANLSHSDGIGVVVEQLNEIDHPDYLLTSVADTIRLVEAAGDRSHGSVGMLADTYHLVRAGSDPVAVIAEHAQRIHHVQFADHPGRGAPGTGDVHFAGVVAALDRSEYVGMIGLEHVEGVEPLRPPADVWRALTEIDGTRE